MKKLAGRGRHHGGGIPQVKPATGPESKFPARPGGEFAVEGRIHLRHYARMIAERFPALTSLSVVEKWPRAAELYEEVESRADEVPVDQEVLAAVEARFSGFESGETTASPWSDVKDRILASRK